MSKPEEHGAMLSSLPEWRAGMIRLLEAQAECFAAIGKSMVAASKKAESDREQIVRDVLQKTRRNA